MQGVGPLLARRGLGGGGVALAARLGQQKARLNSKPGGHTRYRHASEPEPPRLGDMRQIRVDQGTIEMRRRSTSGRRPRSSRSSGPLDPSRLTISSPSPVDRHRVLLKQSLWR